MLQTPRVSVVMASYSHEKFVGEAIESVLAQSFGDFEFIITDDGSSDETPDIIRGYTDSRIDFEAFTVNKGACEAANQCIERAKGDYVAVLSSDDFFLPGKLERQVAMLDASPDLAAVFGLVEFVDDESQAIPAEQNPLADNFITTPPNRFAWLRHLFLHGNALCHSTVMVRRRIYEELGGYDVALRQLPDMDLWVRVCAHYPIRVLPEALTGFRVLRDLRNVSAASPSQLRRSIWEHSRVLRRYWAIEEETLQRAFGTDIPQEVAERGLPMPVQLAVMAATTDLRRYAPEALQLYALETLENAIARGVPGVGPKDLHALTGDLDPFRFTEIADSLAARASLEVHSESVERARDQTLARIVELEGQLQRGADTAREAAIQCLEFEEKVARLQEALSRTGAISSSLSESHAKSVETIAGLELERARAGATIARLQEQRMLLAESLDLREQQIAQLEAAVQANVKRSLFRIANTSVVRYRTLLEPEVRRFLTRAAGFARRVSKR
jgi:glycosyltransferase involved in cell wall biosynthesis